MVNDRNAMLLKAIEIADEIISNSQMDEVGKRLFKDSFIWNINILKKEKLKSAQLKSLVDGFFIFWNESICIETELFWEKIQENGIDFKRKEPLKFALKHGRFINVHTGMEARKNWDLLKSSHFLKKEYTEKEILLLDEIIINDEIKRYTLLRSCLTSQKIPRSKYLKFGESLAYFNTCQLYGKYFSHQEIADLTRIWQGYK